MTKRELLAALEAFGDDQHVFVNPRSRDYPGGSQVIIQGVTAKPPWHGGNPDGGNWLVGLDAHAENGSVATVRHEGSGRFTVSVTVAPNPWAGLDSVNCEAFDVKSTGKVMKFDPGAAKEEA